MTLNRRRSSYRVNSKGPRMLSVDQPERKDPLPYKHKKTNDESYRERTSSTKIRRRYPAGRIRRREFFFFFFFRRHIAYNRRASRLSRKPTPRRGFSDYALHDERNYELSIEGSKLACDTGGHFTNYPTWSLLGQTPMLTY